jgi:hypothetical protein
MGLQIEGATLLLNVEESVQVVFVSSAWLGRGFGNML